MNVIIGTPMGSSGPTWNYTYSLVKTACTIQRINSIRMNYVTTTGEITARARNTIAHTILASGFDKLFFIDSDMGWQEPDFFKILESPHPIIAGIAPPKSYPLTLNFTELGDETRLKSVPRPTPEDLPRLRQKYGSSVFPVALTGPAFMCIDRKVFLQMSEVAEPYEWESLFTKGDETHWDFFPQGPVGRIYYPEDWGFCNLAKRCEIPIHVDTSVILTHMGNHIFEVPKEASSVATTQSK